ncbi:MAG: hypothetical protein K2X91_00240, partial [Thermoleophilia bacterium]|nr:hypothetical protein [Thermoleophilia bacterium]
MSENDLARWERWGRTRRMGKTAFTALVATIGTLGACFPLIPFLMLSRPGEIPTQMLIGVGVAGVLGLIGSAVYARWSWDYIEEKYRDAQARARTPRA